jgi:acetate kinase
VTTANLAEIMSTKSVLILNMGSSSLKWVVLDASTEAIQQQGDAHWQGAEHGRHEQEILAALIQVRAVNAVGHRVVHGGSRFRDGVLVDEHVRQEIAGLAELAPLHNPAALAGIDAASRRFPGIDQVAAFDTGFHREMPEAAAVYPVPWDWTTRWGLRRFGFHGLSVSYAVQRARDLLGRLPHRLVVCHLGAGCSVTAVEAGRSIETSMGFTPLEGVMMTQRSGSIDPGMLLYLLKRRGLKPAELDKALNEESGLWGVSGVSTDLREVLQAATAGDLRAQLARDMFVHRLVAAVGAMVATLNGLDALIFTGGIGEHSAPIRAAACAAFGYLGLQLDPAHNEANPVDAQIGARGSLVHVLVLTAREDLAILRQVRRVLRWE